MDQKLVSSFQGQQIKKGRECAAMYMLQSCFIVYNFFLPSYLASKLTVSTVDGLSWTSISKNSVFW